jgi:hypothetical protein
MGPETGDRTGTLTTYADPMPTCSFPFLDRLLLPTLLGGSLFALLAAVIGHSVMRTFLEARGVQPWGIFDSLRAIPFALLGAALIGVAVTLTAGLLVLECRDLRDTPSVLIADAVCALGGMVLLRTGLLGVRRLT